MADEFVRRTGGADWVSYWAAARVRELRFQRCTGCRRWRHPPGPMCPHCLSMESEWAQASGRARLVSWVVVHPPVLPAWKDRVPYPVVLVECEEGVRTIGGLVGATADQLRMDMPVVGGFPPSPGVGQERGGILLPVLSGGCAWGAIRYRCTAAPLFSLICHCRDCQRGAGSAFVPVLGVGKATFVVSQGSRKCFELTADRGHATTR